MCLLHTKSLHSAHKEYVFHVVLTVNSINHLTLLAETTFAVRQELYSYVLIRILEVKLCS
jgi:hypothetical protein